MREMTSKSVFVMFMYTFTVCVSAAHYFIVVKVSSTQRTLEHSHEALQIFAIE